MILNRLEKHQGEIATSSVTWHEILYGAGIAKSARKRDLIEKVTDAMVSVEGEALRGVTWVRVQEIEQGDWGIGGKTLTAADIHALAGQKAA